ncbi:hypothetical protein EHF33_11585 [Deinococcus psychrotolerans]|uniref:Uncharacterized protein n=1 Tax=Deinococcus psychrotolerans TaxID=2489213 RepID=A0A3G8YL38_9DEIO|nr:hypothetical protein [Deinococcus psychrotolerans]AZI43304.1 hypothetical protein EHF33_11585 [Deinococcus psychrotolerans]
MKLLWIALLAASLAAASPTTAQGYEMKSYLNLNGAQPAAFWCDTPERVLAVTQPKGTGGAAQPVTQPVKLLEWAGGDSSVQDYQLGPSDAGAGNLYTALTPAGQKVSQTPRYYVHSSNIENVNDPLYRMTHVNAFKVSAGTFACRYKPQAAFIGATAKHSITVWESGDKVTYSSSNHDGTPGLYLMGGTHSGQHYRWTNNGYTYALTLDDPAATLSVLRGAKVLSKEAFLAYSVSTRK